MKRLYVLNAQVGYTPGVQPVEIRVQCTTLKTNGDPVEDRQETIITSQEVLGNSWGDDEIREAAQLGLEAAHPSDEIEVITIAEWLPRWEVIVAERKSALQAAEVEAAEAISKVARLRL